MFKIIILLIMLIFFYYIEMQTFSTTNYTIVDNKIKNNLKIVHLSDFHAIKFISNNKILLEKIKKINPDIIVVTGDIVMHKYNIENALLLMKQLSNITTTYFVRGNHDIKECDSYKLIKDLKSIGIIISENSSIYFEKNNIFLHGLIDFTDEDYLDKSFVKTKKIRKLEKLKVDTNKYNILMTHRPYDFKLFTEYNMDLTLCGHTHGGQWIIPFIGGFVSPDLKLFPEYDYGLKEIEGKKMIINRGLGGKLWAIRIFNRPEIGIINLKSTL